MLTLPLLLAAAVPAIAVTPGEGSVRKQEYKVEVGGRRYRVLVKADGEVEAARKAMITAYTPDERERMRAAVKAATGCDRIDEFAPTMERLKGRLACPEWHYARADAGRPRRN